jgi:hypothetical protein
MVRRWVSVGTLLALSFASSSLGFIAPGGRVRTYGTTTRLHGVVEDVNDAMKVAMKEKVRTTNAVR